MLQLSQTGVKKPVGETDLETHIAFHGANEGLQKLAITHHIPSSPKDLLSGCRPRGDSFANEEEGNEASESLFSQSSHVQINLFCDSLKKKNRIQNYRRGLKKRKYSY